jgi:hypothetical protein
MVFLLQGLWVRTGAFSTPGKKDPSRPASVDTKHSPGREFPGSGSPVKKVLKDGLSEYDELPHETALFVTGFRFALAAAGFR